jgi:diguanylate cyclase (GGDEF)-like protein
LCTSALPRGHVGAGPGDPLVHLTRFLACGIADERLAQRVADEFAELSGASLIATYTVELEGLSLAGFSNRAGFDHDGVPKLVVRAFESGDAVRARAEDLAELHGHCGPAAAALAVPLVVGEKSLGVLLLATGASDKFEDHQDLALAAADLMAAILSANRTVTNSRAEARRDALTGLPNRRAFDEHLERTIFTLTGTSNLVLALLDLDEFKKINDEAGHAVGDEVLRTVGRVLSRALRAEEEIFRIGGDEFALVFKGEAATSFPIVTRLRHALTRHRRRHPLPTLSAGVSTLPALAQTRRELFEQADNALFAAKRAGRNQIVITQPEPDTNAEEPCPN